MPLAKKTPLSLLVIVLLACIGSASTVAASSPAVAGDEPKRDIRKIVIADGIYEFMTMADGYVEQLNSVVIVNESDVVVFDTTTRPSSARIILAEIRKITDKPVRYVANSHWHPDHWSGNEVFAQAFPGLEIIATEQTRLFMQNVANAWLPRFAASRVRLQAEFDKKMASGKQDDGTPLTDDQRRKETDDMRMLNGFFDEAAIVHRTYPTLTYVDKLTLYHGGREFRFMSVTGDAEGTTVLYLPKEKVLITGDAISYPLPYTTPPPSHHAKSLRALGELDVDVIIPGHGPAFRDKNYLNLEAELLESVTREVRDALQKGMSSLDEVQKAVTLEYLRVRFTHDDKELDEGFRALVKGLVGKAIREARDGQDYR